MRLKLHRRALLALQFAAPFIAAGSVIYGVAHHQQVVDALKAAEAKSDQCQADLTARRIEIEWYVDEIRLLEQKASIFAEFIHEDCSASLKGVKP